MYLPQKLIHKNPLKKTQITQIFLSGNLKISVSSVAFFSKVIVYAPNKRRHPEFA